MVCLLNIICVLLQDDIEDPLKEERLRRQKELAEDEAELAAMDTGAGGEDAGKRRKMAEFNLWKSQRRQSDPNKVNHFHIMFVIKLRYL